MQLYDTQKSNPAGRPEANRPDGQQQETKGENRAVVVMIETLARAKKEEAKAQQEIYGKLLEKINDENIRAGAEFIQVSPGNPIIPGKFESIPWQKEWKGAETSNGTAVIKSPAEQMWFNYQMDNRAAYRVQIGTPGKIFIIPVDGRDDAKQVLERLKEGALDLVWTRGESQGSLCLPRISQSEAKNVEFSESGILPPKHNATSKVQPDSWPKIEENDKYLPQFVWFCNSIMPKGFAAGYVLDK